MTSMTGFQVTARSLWRNWLARSAVNRKVGGSSPPRDVCNCFTIVIALGFSMIGHTASKLISSFAITL